MADPTQLEGIDFVNDQERQYFAEAVIGEEVRQFLVSSVGKFLHGCAKAEYDNCRDEMFDLDPYTPEGKREYMRLKANAWAASHFMEWCVEAVQNGNNAATQLEHYRENLGE
jgi:hypothetical protein